MTLKLERGSDGNRSTLRLIGYVRSEDLEEIADELEMCGSGAALDLEEVTVVGVEVIRFLNERERQGTEAAALPDVCPRMDLARRGPA